MGSVGGAAVPLSWKRVGDDLAPRFQLVIHGQGVSGVDTVGQYITDHISRIVWERDVDMATMLEMTVVSADKVEFGQPTIPSAVLDSKVFAEGNAIDVLIGYGDDLRPVGRVEVVKHLPQFPEGGVASVMVKGYDVRHRMSKNRVKGSKRNIRFVDQTDEQIVSTIAAKYGMLASTQPPLTEKRTRVQAPDVGDWEFIRKVARENGYNCGVVYVASASKWAVLLRGVRERESQPPKFLFSYKPDDPARSSLLSCSLEFSIAEQLTGVEVLYYDKAAKAIVSALVDDTVGGEAVKLTTASPGALSAKKSAAVGARVRYEAFGQVWETFTDRPFKSPAEAKKWVETYLLSRERDLIVAKGTVVGWPELKPNQVHTLSGMGTRIDGDYRFTMTRHVLEPGRVYNVEFEAHKVLSPELSRRPRPPAALKIRDTSDPVEVLPTQWFVESPGVPNRIRGVLALHLDE